jgi:hypothetical protein
VDVGLFILLSLDPLDRVASKVIVQLVDGLVVGDHVGADGVASA